MLSEKKIDMGHAKVLLVLDNEDQVRVGNMIIERQLSVRQTEKIVREQQYRDTASEQIIDYDLLKRADDLKNDLSEFIGKSIDVKLRNQHEEKGYLKVAFSSLDELADLLKLMKHDHK